MNNLCELQETDIFADAYRKMASWYAEHFSPQNAAERILHAAQVLIDLDAYLCGRVERLNYERTMLRDQVLYLKVMAERLEPGSTERWRERWQALGRIRRSDESSPLKGGT